MAILIKPRRSCWSTFMEFATICVPMCPGITTLHFRVRGIEPEIGDKGFRESRNVVLHCWWHGVFAGRW